MKWHKTVLLLVKHQEGEEEAGEPCRVNTQKNTKVDTSFEVNAPTLHSKVHSFVINLCSVDDIIDS